MSKALSLAIVVASAMISFVTAGSACNGDPGDDEPPNPPANGDGVPQDPNGGGDGPSGPDEPDLALTPPELPRPMPPRWRIPEDPMEPPSDNPGEGLHSPLTASVVDRLATIAGRDSSLRDDRLAKVGDSHSVGGTFLQCFSGAALDLASHGNLHGVIDHFGRPGHDLCPLGRDSLATVAGIGVNGLLRDDPNLVAQEVDVMRPRFAVVMIGTNDARQGRVHDYSQGLVTLLDQLTARGVIPLVSTIPPMSEAYRHQHVRRFNSMIMAAASIRGLPLVDLYEALLPAPSMGLRSDGIHLSVDWNRWGALAACRMSENGLAHGANIRNLLTLEQLDRAMRAVLSGEILDPEPTTRRGSGTAADPLLVEKLPFGEGRGLRDGALRPAADLLAPCAGGGFESGLAYEVELLESALLHAILDTRRGARGTVEIRSSGDWRCLAYDDREAVAELGPGRYLVVVRAAGTEGEILLGITDSQAPD